MMNSTEWANYVDHGEMRGKLSSLTLSSPFSPGSTKLSSLDIQYYSLFIKFLVSIKDYNYHIYTLDNPIPALGYFWLVLISLRDIILVIILLQVTCIQEQPDIVLHPVQLVPRPDGPRLFHVISSEPSFRVKTHHSGFIPALPAPSNRIPGDANRKMQLEMRGPVQIDGIGSTHLGPVCHFSPITGTWITGCHHGMGSG